MTRRDRIQAQDIMQRDVLELDPSMPIERAIEALEQNEIGGAPVVDGAHRLLGMLSASDVTRSDHVASNRLAPTRGEFALTDPPDEEEEVGDSEDVILDMEDYSPATRESDTVQDWMNTGVVTVRPDDSLVQVCRTMVKHRVHRVVVTSGDRIEGILSSFDVVRAVAGAPDGDGKAR